MATFVIRGVEKKRQFDTQHGTFQAYALTLEAADKSLVTAELVQKPETAQPAIGASVEGTLEDGQYGKRFKKDRAPGAPGGRAPVDPKRETRITHMHAQKCALSYAHLRQAQGKLPAEFGLQDLFIVAKKFREDVESIG
jgi:hypothetical protein